MDKHINLGILLYELKRPKDAEKEFREAIKINPELAETYNLEALLKKLKKYREV